MKKKKPDKNNGRKSLCSFIKNPFDGCYVKDMTSLKVPAALHYCARNYENCEIFKEKSRKRVRKVV